MTPPEATPPEATRPEATGPDVTHANRMDQQFGKVASQYATSEHAGGADLARLLALAEPSAGDRALDVATGAGHVAAALAPHVAEVVATDIASGMLEQARRTLEGAANATVAFADAEDLPFPDGRFELVTCRIAPHHFLDPAAFVRQVARVLVPGGRFVLVDSLAPDDPDAAAFLHEVEVRRDSTHVRAYTAGEWRSMAADAGLTVESEAVERKNRDFERWLERGSTTPEVRAELHRRFREAPLPVRQAFDVVVAGERVVSFADDKLVLLARR
jgi:ubiquinone/menaquinone biosynthesis C-methylase UbiE